MPLLKRAGHIWSIRMNDDRSMPDWHLYRKVSMALILGLLSGFMKLAGAWVQRSRDSQLISTGEAA